MKKERNKAYLALLTTTLFWGISVPVIKYTLRFIDPFAFLFWRFLLVTVILSPIFLITLKKTSIKISDLPKLFCLGSLSTTLCLSLLFYGMQYASAIDVSLISILSPVIIVLGGAFFLQEKVTKQEKIGLSIAFFGALITLLQPLLERKIAHPKAVLGNILVFASYIAWASYTLLWKNQSKKYHPMVITFFNFFAGLLTIIPIYLLTNQLPATSYQLPADALPGILYMAIFSSVIAYFTYNYGVSKIEASEATLFTYLQPLFAVPLSVLWLREKITLPFIIGAIFIIGGVSLSEIRKRVVR